MFKLFRCLFDFAYPGVEIFLRSGDSFEFHAGETRAAVVGGDTVHFSVLVGDQVQFGLHARHRVDLTAQSRDEERVHHGVGSDLEVDRGVRREHDLVDRGDALFRVDEQPLPVQRDHFNGDWLDVGFQRLVRVQCVGRLVGDVTQGNDDQYRNSPHRDFDLGGVGPFWRVDGVLVGSAVFPGEQERHDDDRHDDQQHQQRCGDDQVSLIQADLALGIEQGHVAASQQQRAEQRQ